MQRGNEIAINPRRFRYVFLGVLAGGLLLIWSAYFAGTSFMRKNLEAGFRERIQTDVIVIDELVSRTLDTVTGKLKSLSAFPSASKLRGDRATTETLHNLIFEDAVMRSISLLDGNRRVVASSSPANIGAVIPEGVLPASAGAPAVAGVKFGSVFPNRELHEVGASRSAEGNSLWLASISAPVAGAGYQWVAVINLGLLQNTWARLDDDDSTEISLFDYNSQRIATHHPVGADYGALTPTLLGNVENRPLGLFEFGQKGRFSVAYRSSETHPVILTIIGDRDRLMAHHAGDFRLFGSAAGLASIIVLALIAFLYGWYLRYENSVIEMANHARGVGAHLMVSETTPDGKIIRVNDAFLETTGYAREEVLGRTHRMFRSGLHDSEFYAGMFAALNSGRIWHGTLRNRNRAGGNFWVDTTIVPFTDAWGKLTRYVSFYTDITDAIALSDKFNNERRLREELARINRELVSDANTDPLTGISNRRAFDSFAEQALLADRELTQPMSVLMLDLDKFKSVNDTYGHGAGDCVLKEMAQRWKSVIRASDMIARLGGEEFCVVLPQTTSAQAMLVAEKIRAVTAAEPVLVFQDSGDIALQVTVSIGAASSEFLMEIEVKDLMQAADEALYEAKHGGRNRVVLHRARPGLAVAA